MDNRREAELLAIIREQQALIERLTARIEFLEAQLAKHSGNSSKPPSSDGLKKPAPKSQREKGKRKSGGQAGHKGETLEAVAEPNEVVVHRLGSCHKQVNAAFPEEIEQPTQYGERFKALLVYLNAYQLLPLGRIAELTDDWFTARKHGLSMLSALVDALSGNPFTPTLIHP